MVPPPAPRGVPQIEVTFDIDADSNVNVHAKDTLTGKNQSMTITPGSGLTEEEIQNMVADAEIYATQDRELKASIGVANTAESVMNDTEKALKEFVDRLDKAEVDQIREKVPSLREFIAKCQSGESSATADDIKQRTNEFQTAVWTFFKECIRPAGRSTNTNTAQAEL